MTGQLTDAGNTTTLAHYLELLQGAGMLAGLAKYSHGQARQRGSSPKLQVLNTALMSAQDPRSLAEARNDGDHWGRLVESAVGAHLLNSSFGTGIGVHYWRERNREVDFVLQQGKSVVAIEVKEVTLGCALKKKSKRWLGIVVVFAAIFTALNILAYRQAYCLTHFVAGGPRTAPAENLSFGQKLKTLFCGVHLPRPRTTLSPASLGPACRGLSFAGANGVRLGAWYCPVSPDSPLVILFHGYAAEKTDTRNEAGVFLEMGLSVLLVDFRGSGDSSESYTTIGHDEAEDVAAAVRYARASLPHSKLVLYGISMGAAAILRAVHSCGVQPDAIIVEAVFDRMLATVGHRFEVMGLPSFPGAEMLVLWGGWQFGFNGFGNNPVEYAPSIRCPILFLHGAADPLAPPAGARQVYDAVPGRKWYKEFIGVGHAASVVPSRRQWKKTVSQFLKDAQVEAGMPASASHR